MDTTHWDNEKSFGGKYLIYNQNLPRTAIGIRIYKLVYSSDLDYKVRKEIVKMIVVQNRTLLSLKE